MPTLETPAPPTDPTSPLPDPGPPPTPEPDPEPPTEDPEPIPDPSPPAPDAPAGPPQMRTIPIPRDRELDAIRAELRTRHHQRSRRRFLH